MAAGRAPGVGILLGRETLRFSQTEFGAAPERLGTARTHLQGQHAWEAFRPRLAGSVTLRTNAGHVCDAAHGCT